MFTAKHSAKAHFTDGFFAFIYLLRQRFSYIKIAMNINKTKTRHSGQQYFREITNLHFKFYPKNSYTGSHHWVHTNQQKIGKFVDKQIVNKIGRSADTLNFYDKHIRYIFVTQLFQSSFPYKNECKISFSLDR